MTISALNPENLAIPVIGICILLVLTAAVLLEPRKDYSRKVFTLMLLSCIAVLTTEVMQWFYEGRGASAVTAFRITMFVFYIALAVISYCWTIYAYYWFNNSPVTKTAASILAVGPLFEALTLLCSYYSGLVFSVDANGVYARGKGFFWYILFSYAYLLGSILVTALLAAGKTGKAHRRDYTVFLLSFLFPIVGPLIQYAFPTLSLMGISETFALLIVYVTIQQRTSARYAVERVRYQDEYKAYETSVGDLLTASANALYVFRLDLTKNTNRNENEGSGPLAAACREGTVDALFEACASEIRYIDESVRFRESFDRKRLIKSYDEQSRQISLEYHRRVENGETHLIRTFLSMLQNPGSGDIEAIVYSVDLDRQEKEEKVISAITDREYDFIALIDAETRRLHYQYSSKRSGDAIRFDMGDYDEVIMRVSAVMHDPAQTGRIRQNASFQTVYDALERQKDYNCVFEYAAPSGEKRVKKISYQYLDDHKTEILFLGSDITDETRQERERADLLQKALQEARHASAMKTEFLSNVSHDMRTPLNAVLGYADLARKAADLTEAQDYLGKIDRAGNILLSLINDTLDLSKIETGAIVLKPVPTRYEELIRRVVAVIRPLAQQKHLRFTVDDSRAARVEVMADALRMQEILLNLLSNAVKFTPEGGEVSFTVECESLDDRCAHDRITVSDTGCGMKPEFIPKMYEPFAQERQTADTTGSGLGLPIVKRLVELMDGTIEVESEAGRGTTFTVRLTFERAEPAAEKVQPAQESFAELSGRHILLVEDNEMNAEIAEAFLEARDMRVTGAINGKIACETFAASAPGDFDAILMDIRMPVLNGREAARTIRAMDRPDAAVIPIIAMSADAFDDDIAESLEAGMNAHLAKPVAAQSLYETLLKTIRSTGRV